MRVSGALSVLLFSLSIESAVIDGNVKTTIKFSNAKPDKIDLAHRRPLLQLTPADLHSSDYITASSNKNTLNSNFEADEIVPLTTITSCGSPEYIFQPSEISISPDPPHRNAKLTFTIKGLLSKEIVQGAYADVRVKLGLIQLIDKRFDLCEEVAKLGEACPFPPGPFTLEKTVDVPGIVPPGGYWAHVEAFSVEEEAVTCLDARFRIPL